MLYLPNNRIKLETSTPKRVLPSATYNSDVQSAPVNLEPLSWKQQCWWMERTLPSTVDCQFVGTDEIANQGVSPRVWTYPLFSTSPNASDGYYVNLYESANIQGQQSIFSYVKKTSYSDDQIIRIASDKPYILVNHPEDTSADINTTIYGSHGHIYNRILLCVCIYVPVDAIEAGKHTYARIKVYGNFGENYLVNNPYDNKYDFYNIHECDVNGETKFTVDPDYSIGANEDYVKWPLYPKEIYNNLGIPERKSLEEIFGNTNPPRLDDYITSQYYEVKVGEPTYIYVLLTVAPANLDFYLLNQCSLDFYSETNASFTGSGIYYPVLQKGVVRYGNYINDYFQENDYDITYDLVFTYKVKVEELTTAPDGDANFSYANITNYCGSEYLNNGYFTRKIKYHFDPTNENYITPIRKAVGSNIFNSSYKKNETLQSELWAGTCYQRRGLINYLTDEVLSSDDMDAGDTVSEYVANAVNPGQGRQ